MAGDIILTHYLIDISRLEMKSNDFITSCLLFVRGITAQIVFIGILMHTNLAGSTPNFPSIMNGSKQHIVKENKTDNEKLQVSRNNENPCHPQAIGFSGLPEDIILTCGSEMPIWPNVVASKGRKEYPVTTKEQTDYAPCGGKIITRTWTVTNDCGDAITRKQSISFSDVIPPFIRIAMDTIVVQENAIPQASYDAGDQGCSTFTVSVTEEKITLSKTQQYAIIRRYVATDGCMNSTTKTQIVLVNRDHQRSSKESGVSSVSIFKE
jgi:hypothetical protein